MGRGKAACPDPSPVGVGHPLPTPNPIGSFGASILAHTALDSTRAFGARPRHLYGPRRLHSPPTTPSGSVPRLSGREFDLRPLHYRLVGTRMGDRLGAGNPPKCRSLWAQRAQSFFAVGTPSPYFDGLGVQCCRMVENSVKYVAPDGFLVFGFYKIPLF